HIRRWLFQRASNKCEQCGWCRVHPVTGLIPLTVNHRDGNSENHRPENLELLCAGCHSLTPHYGKLNQGRGRRSRLQRLRQSGGDVAQRESAWFATTMSGVRVPPSPHSAES